MDIYDLCFSEWQYGEVVFNAPITFDDFQEASESYNLEEVVVLSYDGIAY